MKYQLRLRPARSEDAEPLAVLAEHTFRDTFAADNEPADMEAYVREAFSAAKVRQEILDPANIFLLAFLKEGESPIGYAKLRTGTHDPSVTGPEPIELERLYVGQAAIGHGVGAALMQECLETAAAKGYQTLWLGVWEENPRAIKFYQRWQFQKVGDHVFRLGSDDQTDWIMERPTSAM